MLITARRSRSARLAGFRLLAEANSADALRNAQTAVDDLPAGTAGRVVIEGFGVGLAADLAGAEQLWGARFTPIGTQLVDVYGNGANTAVVDWKIPAAMGVGVAMGNPLPPVLLLSAIAAVLISLGWLVSKITVFFEDVGGPVGIGLLALATVLIVGAASGKRGRA